ncbi:MAG: hypothetical protein DI563_09230 [Variovorax paradoxus]|uniref:Uncharacterized protein n=1 Tax=Variovorax paradoxus TaxID=34073 RepID=A0A2W5SL81_VARPD|nr:MAG: hypothetical protein DI563_09230 [Variovorax paradoxus]
MKQGDGTQPSSGQLLLLGVAQAVGFLVGALPLAPEGYSGRAMGGIALVGLGGGGGVQLARRWYHAKYGDTHG